MLIAGTWFALSYPDPSWSDIWSSPFLCSYQLIVKMLLSFANSFTLYTTIIFSCTSLSFFSLFKDFEDLGFDMNPTIHIESQFPAQYLLLTDWLHAFPIFQLATCRFHEKYKRFDLISLILRNIFHVGSRNDLHQSLWSYKLICWHFALLGSWNITDTRHILYSG